MKKGTKRENGNKSQIIRDFAAANPGLKSSEIVRALNEQGHKVYAAIVSQALRGTAGAKKPGTKNAVKATAAATEFDLSSIKAAAAFVKATGGVDAAISSIKSFQKISELLK
jgi:arginine repressor